MEVLVKDKKLKGRGILLSVECLDLYVDGEGGQLGDRGTIGNMNFHSVERIDGIPWIFVDSEIPDPLPEKMDLRIDKARRQDIAEQHTAQHLLSAVFQEEFDAKTAGFQMGEVFSTIDLELGVRDTGIIDLAEEITNSYVQKCLPVTIAQIPAEEIGSFDLRKPVSEKVLAKTSTIKVVTIEDLDRNACGGFHVDNTGRLGLIKIVKTEKVKGNLTRIHYVAGKRALKDYVNKSKLVDSLVKYLTCGSSEIEQRISTTIQDLKTAKNNEKKLSERLGESIAKELKKTKNEIMFIEDEDSIINSIPRFLSGESFIFIGKSKNRFTMTSKKYNCRDLLEYIKRSIEVSGGAGPNRGQFISGASLDTIENIVKEFLEKGDKE